MARTIKKVIRKSDIALSGLTRGNDIALKFTITTPTALSAAKLVIKANKSDADGSALANKVVTLTPNADGQILDSGLANGVAIVLFVLPKTLTDDFTADQTYFWDVEVFDVSNNANTPRGGTIVFTQRVRTAVG
jgi:predicted RecA/RadA family phage recombinase